MKGRVLKILFHFIPFLAGKKLGMEKIKKFAAGEKMNLVHNIHTCILLKPQGATQLVYTYLFFVLGSNGSWSEEFKTAVVDLLVSGCSHLEISRQLGVKYKWVVWLWMKQTKEIKDKRDLMKDKGNLFIVKAKLSIFCLLTQILNIDNYDVVAQSHVKKYKENKVDYIF